MKSFLIYISFLLLNFGAIAQDSVWVRMEKKNLPEYIRGYQMPLIHTTDTSGYIGIPSMGQDSVWLGRIIMNRKQYIFDKYKAALSEKSKDLYLDYIKKNKIDTTELYHKELKTYVGVLSMYGQNQKTIIVDTDNDHDFSDETKISYSLTNYKPYYNNIRKSQVHQVFYEEYVNGQIYIKNEFLKLAPFDKDYTFKVLSDTLKNTFYNLDSYLLGKFKNGDSVTELNALRRNYNFITDDIQDYDFNLVSDKEKLIAYNWINAGANIKLGDKIMTVLEMSVDSILVKYRDITAEDFGWQIGDYVPERTFKKYKMDVAKKYVFLNFWGSWCIPCIKEIPRLKDLYEKNAPLIDLINIANEKLESDFPKARQIVDEENLNWRNFYELIDLNTSLSKALNVNSYPTMLVLNNQGKILAREIGFGNIERLIKMFDME